MSPSCFGDPGSPTREASKAQAIDVKGENLKETEDPFQVHRKFHRHGPNDSQVLQHVDHHSYGASGTEECGCFRSNTRIEQIVCRDQTAKHDDQGENPANDCPSATTTALVIHPKWLGWALTTRNSFTTTTTSSGNSARTLFFTATLEHWQGVWHRAVVSFAWVSERARQIGLFYQKNPKEVKQKRIWNHHPATQQELGDIPVAMRAGSGLQSVFGGHVRAEQAITATLTIRWRWRTGWDINGSLFAATTSCISNPKKQSRSALWALLACLLSGPGGST